MLKCLMFLVMFVIPAQNAAVNDNGRRFIGDYAGWAYQTEGGDYPLRFHIRENEGRPTITIDSPVERAFELSTTNPRSTGDQIEFERRNSQGKLWQYQARLQGDVLSGEARIDGQLFSSFEMRRSAEPLPTVDPARYADCVGLYRLGPGREIVISAWFWGELRFTDTQTGRHATLFARSESEFFAGPAMYVPASVFARLRFIRDEKGGVTKLVWQQGDEPPLTGEKISFVEEAVEFASGDLKIRGTLIQPSAAGPHPAIVVLGGSNWRTRGQVRQDADLFVAMGFAALTYDQRGCGESTGNPVCSFEETASDARAAVAFLKGRSGILTNCIGLSGRSRGGWLAPLAASKCKEAAFLVLFVPPAISPAQQETTRRLNEMRAAGFGEPDVREAAAYLELLWRCTRSDEDWQRYVARRDQLESRPWFSHVGGLATRDSEDYEWDRLNMDYDPLPALQSITCPVLALFGEQDRNVTPAENLPRMKAALERAGNKNFTLKIVAGADHGLRLTGPQAAAQPLHRAVGFAPETWPLVREWLNGVRSLVPRPPARRPD